MSDRLSNRRLGAVLFDPHDEYFIPAAKATDLAALRFVAPPSRTGRYDL
jgi:hypothetical protein